MLIIFFKKIEFIDNNPFGCYNNLKTYERSVDKMEQKDDLFVIAFKSTGRRKVLTVILGIILVLVLVLILGDFAHYQLYPIVLGILLGVGGFLFLWLLWFIVRPYVVVDHDGKRVIIHRIFTTCAIAIRDIDMVYSRRFSWEVFSLTTGTLYIVTRNRGIIKVRNVKEVDQAKMRLIILINNYKQLFKEND
ncbi:MAG: hypothetical protein PHG08_02585 [Bacilli bacterium]|nr:hypothetical protein [Bacilli bacterium]